MSMERERLNHLDFSGRLAGRVAIVSGAGSIGPGIGNGRAIAILMARAGAKVVLADRQKESARETQRIIDGEGGEAFTVACDVANSEDCHAVAEAAADTYGTINILVNNVGVASTQGTAVDVSLEDWDLGLRINVTSMMLMTKYSAPYMKQSGGGSIVNIASIAGLFGGFPDLLYPTSKGAVINLTRAMAANHGPDGIRVNCIAPGMVYTPHVAQLHRGMTPELRETRRLRSPLRVEGTPWDVAMAALFLAGEEARWVTGVILPVDGGVTAVMPDVPVPKPEA